MRRLRAAALLASLLGGGACTSVVRYTNELVSDEHGRTYFTRGPEASGATLGFTAGIPIDVAVLPATFVFYRTQPKETRDPLSMFLFPSFVLWKAGSLLGSGAVVIMDETTCMVRMLRRISRFYYAESCGQCTPCREGTGWLHRMLSRIIDGNGRPEDLDILKSVADNIEGRTICALGDAAAWPVQSFLKHYRHEFEYMIEHRGRSIVESQGLAAEAAE